VGQAHFLSKQIYDTFPILRKQVLRRFEPLGIRATTWLEYRSRNNSPGRFNVILYPAHSGPQVHSIWSAGPHWHRDARKL